MARYVVKGDKIELSQEKNNNKWYNNFFREGYGNNLTEKFLMSGADLLSDVLVGALTPVESVIDLGTNAVAGVQNFFGYKDAAQKTRDFANQNIFENMFKDEYMENASVFGDTSDKIANSIGNIAALAYGGKVLTSATGVSNIGVAGKTGNTAIGASLSGGNIGLTISGKTLNLPTLAIASGASSGLKDANLRENVNEAERWIKALSSGLIEGTTEGIFGLLGVGGSDLSENIARKAASKFSSKAGKMLAQIGVSSAGEATEEFLAYVGNYLVDNHLIDKIGKADFSSNFDWGELGEQMALAYVSSVLTQGGGTIINTNNAIRSAEQQLGRKLTNQEKAQVTQSSIEGTIIEKIEKLKKQQEAQNTTPKIPTVNDIVAQEKNNNAKESINQTLPVKDLNFIESARKYNLDSNSETIRSIDNLLKNRNIHGLFDASRFNDKNTNAFWTIDENGNRNVILNPEAETPDWLQNVAIHELTHDLLSSKNSAEMLNTKEILDFISTKEGYAEARNSLIEAYSKVYDPNSAKFQKIIDEEIVASVLGNKLGTQEFVNQLVYEKPTIAKRILTWIENRINNLKKLVGYTSEKNFWEDVKKRFVKAYKMSYNNTTNQADIRFAKYGTNLDLSTVKEGELLNDFHDALTPRQWIKYHTKMNRVMNSTYGDLNRTDVIDGKIVCTEIINHKEQVVNVLKTSKNYKAKVDYILEEANKYGYSGHQLQEVIENSIGKENVSRYDTTDSKFKRISKLDSDIGKIIESSKQHDGEATKRGNKQDNSRELGESSSFSLKQKQLDIILENNPMLDDYHVGIRNINDIKTFDEVIDDDESFVWGDFSPEDAKKALEKGVITIYSSLPIENGVFVSTSRNQARDYAGNSNVYSKEVPLNEVAWINGDEGQYAKVNDVRLSQKSNLWSDFVNKNFKSDGTGQTLQQVKLPTRKDISSVENNTNKSKVLNPLEISKLRPKDANTTPTLPDRTYNKNNDGNSHFFENIRTKTNMLNENQKNVILNEDDVKYYDKITNKVTLEKAFDRLNENGAMETNKWFAKDSENATAVDVAEGWILLKQYADKNDADGMVAVAKKLRDMGTKAGQTLQAFNIMERMSPEGMVKYAQSELSEAYEKMVKNKSSEWIEKYRDDFDLKPEEVSFIMQTMEEVQHMEDGYEKRVKLAEIQKVMTDKLPPERGAGIKAWMRISMLFNPKTQVRNVMGNAVIAPVNYFSDLFSSIIDEAISKKTGVRTIGKTDLKSYAKGFKSGLYQSYNDFKKGINTRDINGNRFEIGQGKSFNDNTKLGKSLNRVDSLLSFMLDAGDRGFYEASFTNSINNQLILNNTTEITQEMIDIATQEALSRTWQDNNGYTKFVLQTRKALNKINVKGYGLGDVLIPFAKTPANLTKAIVDYSPAGLIKTIIDGNNLKKSLSNGQYNAQLQHQFVQELGKATAGTMLYILGYALAKAGIVSGESDDDKDTRDFMKNTLGVSSYSIKIGNKSFTYDWAQPIAAPLSIMANYVQKSEKNKDASKLENLISSLDVAGNILLQQSFMESINTVLNNNDGIATGIQEAIMELPSRAIPTLMKQIVDLTDGTQRQTFEYDQPLKTAINKVKAKIPGLSQTLSPAVDTMGREIQKYGGKNNIFNVFFNPANVSTENVSTSAKEIYALYKQTGETTIMPRVAPYYVNKNGNKIVLDSKQRAEYQKISGKIIEENIDKLIGDSNYNNLSNEEKVNIISNIVNFSYNVAQSQILGTEISNTYKKAYIYSLVGNVSDYYLYKSQKFEADYYPNGNVIANSKKMKIIRYINSLNLSIPEKAILIKMEYNNYNNYNSQIVSYINKMNYSIFEKATLLKSLGFNNYDKYIINQVNSQNISIEEKIRILESLGFTIRNGRVYY